LNCNKIKKRKEVKILMKKLALMTGMVAILLVSASIAFSATGLYSPWLTETQNSTNPTTGSFNTQIYVYNSSTSAFSGNMIFRKYSKPTTTTTIAISVPSKDTVVYSWSAYSQTTNPNWFGPSTLQFRGGTLELVQNGGTVTVDSLLGFSLRYRPNYVPIYSEPLFAK
jgi:hypothetical protein